MQTINTNYSQKFHKFLTGFLLVLCVSFYSNKANAQVASGAATTCANASAAVTALAGDFLTIGCTASTINISAASTGVANCGGTTRSEGWFKFTTTASTGPYVISASTNAGNTTNLQLQVYASCGSAAIACADAFPNTTVPQTEQLSLTLSATTVYFVRVINAGTAAGAMATGLCILNSSTTQGITSCNPTPLSATCNNGAALFQSLSNAYTAGFDPVSSSGCSPTAPIATGVFVKEHWYSYTIFTNQVSQVISVAASTVTATNVIVQIFQENSNSCSSLSLITCANATNTLAAQTEVATTPPEPPGTYLIRVLDYFNTFTTNSLSKLCVNTTCAAANALTLGTCRSGNGYIAANSTTAFPTANPPCATMSGEQWYTYTPAATGTNYTVTGSAFGSSSLGDNLILQVLTGTCGSLSPSSCTDIFPNSATGAQTEEISFNGTAGTPVYIRFISTNGIVTDSLTSICINQTPANDEPICNAAFTLGAASATCSPTYGTLLGATYSLPACTVGSDVAWSSNEDVWYSFAAANAIQTIVVTPNSTGMDPAFDVYTQPAVNTCSTAPTASALSLVSGNPISCIDGQSAGNQESVRLTGLTVGQIYWVRVYDNSPYVVADPVFSICVTETPPNDDCSGGTLPAYTLSSAACTNGDINGATNSGINSSCGPGGTQTDVWYNITIPAWSSKTITLTPSASLNAVIEYYPSGATLSCTNASFLNAGVGCFNGTGTAGAGVATTGIIENMTNATVTYIVRVYHYAGGIPLTTTFQICITDSPANDHICSATLIQPTITGGCSPVTGDINGADLGYPTIGAPCGGAYNDVWYKFIPTGSNGQSYILNIKGSASFNPSFEVFTATTTNCAATGLATLTSVGSTCTNVTGVGAAETLTFTIGGAAGTITVTAGTTYYIRVFNSGGGTPATTTFTVCLTEQPLNDLPCLTNGFAGTGAIGISPGSCYTPTVSNSYLDGATSTLTNNCGTGVSVNDVWFKFNATSASTTVTVTGLLGYNPIAELYTLSSCVPVYANQCTSVTTANGVSTAVFTGLSTTVGFYYYVRVYDESGVVTSGSNFQICLSNIVAPPSNDHCSGYINVPVSNYPYCNKVNGTVAAATQDAGAGPNTGCGTIAGSVGGFGLTSVGDVWYYFTAGTTSETVEVQGSSGFRPVFEVFDQACDTVINGGIPSSLGCYVGAAAGSLDTALITGLTPLANYFVRVYDYTGAPTSTGFTICVHQLATTAGVPASVNSSCATAIPVQCNNSMVLGNTVGGGASPALLGTCPAGSTGVWYSLVGPPLPTTSITLSTSNSNTHYDTQINVYTGTGCGALTTCVASNDNDGNPAGPSTTIYKYNLNIGWGGANYRHNPPDSVIYLGSTVNFATTPGQIYYIFVSGPTAPFTYTNHYGGQTKYDNYLTNTGVQPSFVDTVAHIHFTIFGNTVDYYITINLSPPLNPSTNSVLGTTGAFGLSITGNPTCTPLVIPLPIELVTFNGKSQGKRNLLNWTTASETNNDYFTVEKSPDALSFQPLTKVAGAGNSSTTLNYSTYDDNPINGVTYYRLKQTDYNGKFTYSSIISVNNSWTNVSVNNVRPNPTNDNINFDFYTSVSGKVTVQILDITGRLVENEIQNVTEGNSTLQGKMEDLSNGVYFLRVSFDKTGEVSVTKVVKN